MKARVIVSFKDEVLDPQGLTIKNALHSLGYKFIKDVRQGKVFDIEIDGISVENAKKYLQEIADKVLANPVIEKFHWEIIEK